MSEEKLDRKPAPAPYAAGTGSVPVGPDRAAFELPREGGVQAGGPGGVCLDESGALRAAAG